MKQLELQTEEAEVLQQILRHQLASLQVELNHTDHLDFRNHLKRRRQVITALLDKASEPAEANA